jgi:hypothetical protein
MRPLLRCIPYPQTELVVGGATAVAIVHRLRIFQVLRAFHPFGHQ